MCDFGFLQKKTPGSVSHPMMKQSFSFNLIGFTPSREVIDLCNGLISPNAHIIDLFGTQFFNSCFECFVGFYRYDLCTAEIGLQRVRQRDKTKGRFRCLAQNHKNHPVFPLVVEFSNGCGYK